MKFFFTFIALMLFFSDSVHAYLDPGMGTMLLQVLAGAALFIGIGWRYIVRFFKNLIKKFKQNDNVKTNHENQNDKKDTQ